MNSKANQRRLGSGPAQKSPALGPLLPTSMELCPNDLPLLLWVCDALQPGQHDLAVVNLGHRKVQVLSEHLHHTLALLQ